MATDSPDTGTDFITRYDMHSPELAQHWDAIVKELHDRGCPVVHSDVGEGYWVVNTHENNSRVANDPVTFTSGTGFMPDRPAEMPYLFPSEADGTFHKAVRDVMDSYFRPKVVAGYEDDIRRIALDLAQGVREAGAAGEEVDVVRVFCNALPGRVFCDAILQMEVASIEDLQKALEATLLGPLEGRGPALMRALDDIDAYLRRRESQPRRDDVAQAILDADFDGVDWTTRVSMLANLTLGGVGTTGFVLAAAIRYLAEHPEERAALIADPARMPKAVEEFLRFFAASVQNGRRVTADVEIDGVKMKAGEYVVMSIGAASRDPAVFQCPHEVDLERPLPNRHMAFGVGIHRCPGSQLARLQLRVGLEVFLSEIPNFTVRPDFEPAFEIGNTRSMKSLPLHIG